MVVNIDARELVLGHCTRVQNKIVEGNDNEYIPTCLGRDRSHGGFVTSFFLCQSYTS